MILFLLVTALINIALGYGLAIYLGHALLPLRARGASEPLHGEVPEPMVVEMAIESLASAPKPPIPAPAALSPGPAAGRPSAADLAQVAVEPAASEGEPELEHQVLAGIEEFRNQLAQMKAQPGTETTAVPASV